jgi:hypothetical protein
MKSIVTQRIGRTILVMLLAAAIAALPALVNFASAAPAPNADVSAVTAMPDCDHHHGNMPNGHTQKTADGCAYPAGCALCFAFVAPGVSSVAYAVSFNIRLDPVLAATNISSLMGNPPFRPPRS